MSKVFIEESTLVAIGDAIRAKTGKEDLIAPLDMPTEITAIQTGGSGGSGVPDDVFLMTGDCSSKLTNNTWNYFMENEPFASQFRSENITNGNNMFGYSKTLKQIPFALNFNENKTNGIDVYNMFMYCNELKELPDLGSPLYVSKAEGIFAYCQNIKEIPQSWVENYKNDVVKNASATNSMGKIFLYCCSLRSIPEEFLKKLEGPANQTAYYYALYNSGFENCNCLDEIRGIPVYGNFTQNVFSSTFRNCYRVQEIIFDTNDDGTPKVAEWKNQTIDLANLIYPLGYVNNASNIINCPNAGIVYEDMVNSSNFKTTEEREAFIASNPNWFATQYECSRYTKLSAINTINSLPDTSAYLAANGGTNTIKFKGAMGAIRSINGDSDLEIEALTAEEIAVAAAKGWTVTLV